MIVGVLKSDAVAKPPVGLTYVEYVEPMHPVSSNILNSFLFRLVFSPR